MGKYLGKLSFIMKKRLDITLRVILAEHSLEFATEVFGVFRLEWSFGKGKWFFPEVLATLS